MGKKIGTMKKKLRGSRGCRSHPGLDRGNSHRHSHSHNTNRRGGSTREACDLMVLLPKSTSKLKCQLLVKEIRERLVSTGYTHMALTHTIYGRPRPIEDRAEIAISSSLWQVESTAPSNATKGTIGGVSTSLKRKLNDVADGSAIENDSTRATIQVLRRLHMVMENVSDSSVFLSNGPQSDLLNGYDLVSIAPTNDATFQSACASATMADIVTLDYTGRGLRLPYRIRSSDVKAVIDRGAAFEIPLAPALLHMKQRKALVHACKELRNNSLGLKPRIIISSGDRVLDGSDVGALALRMPGDLSNLCKVVMQFDDSTSTKAVGVTALEIIRRGLDRRRGISIPIQVSIMSKGDILQVVASNGKSTQANKATMGKKLKISTESDGTTMPILDEKGSDKDDDCDLAEDGFIEL